VIISSAQYLVELGHVGGWITVDRAGRRCDDVDLVLEDEFVRELCGAALVGLAILRDELDLVGFTTDLKTGLERFANAIKRPVLRFGETGHRAGLRADVADLDNEIVGAQLRRSKHRGRGKCCGPNFQYSPAGWTPLQ